jgi:putative ABC transport system ATP-binding protein
VLVTHDPLLATYADRRIVLRDGLIVGDEINPAPAAFPREAAALAEG